MSKVSWGHSLFHKYWQKLDQDWAVCQSLETVNRSALKEQPSSRVWCANTHSTHIHTTKHTGDYGWRIIHQAALELN